MKMWERYPHIPILITMKPTYFSGLHQYCSLVGILYPVNYHNRY